MLYCAAAETGYESLSGKSSAVFIPKRKNDAEGNPVTGENGRPVYEQPEATTGDYLVLANAAIIAAYASNKSEAPVSTDEILYDLGPEDIALLIQTVIRLRNQWYHVPEIVDTEQGSDGEERPKN